MSLLEKISPAEGNAFSNYIEYYAGFDGDGISRKASIDHILRIWNENKQDLCKMFNGELILTKQVSFIKPFHVLEEEIYDQCFGYDSKGREFYSAYNDWTHDVWRRDGNQELSYKLCRLMAAEVLAKNIYDGESFCVSVPNSKTPIQINSGCKVSKMLGKLAVAFNLPGYEDFRIAHSMCLNQKTLKGELCLSIHPLDYATMSDNNCDWTSCMSWYDNGDYRQGTVEMMNSSCVVVVYLKSSNNMNAGGIEWSNKKWRQLFIVTPEVVVGIKQYPYENDELQGIALKWLRELAERNCGWGPYTNNAVTIRNNCTNTFAELGLSTYMSFTTHFMYNDMYSDHLAYVSNAVETDFRLEYSGPAECMCCGDDISSYEVDHDMRPSELSCMHCTNYFRCDDCGDVMHTDCSHYVDGLYLCDYCYESDVDYCDFCEEPHLNDNTYTIYLRHNGKVLGNRIKVCVDCFKSNDFIKECGEVSEVQEMWSYRTVVDSKNLSDWAWELFGFDEDEIEEMKKSIDVGPNAN